jgi:hypothetical protein
VKRLALLLLLVVVTLAAAAELLGPGVAERTLAARVQEAASLSAPPEVEVRGRPFLSQVVRGSYEDVVVRAARVPAGEVYVRSVVVQLTDVQVPLRAVLERSVDEVPVGRVGTRAVLGYDDLTAVVADRGLRVSEAESGLVRVTGGVDVLGRRLEAAAVSRPVLDGRTLVITAERFEVGSGLADDLLTRALGDRLDVRVELAPLPYGLQLRSLRAGPSGVVLEAQAVDTVLRAEQP